MNTEDFVTYKQALALKKLGFKEKCFYHYDVSGIIHNNDVICNEVFQCVISSQLLGSHNSGIPKETCDAPTLAQVQKWLRKEKGLYLIWDMGQDRKHNSKFAWYVNDCHGNIVDVLASEVKYNTPEAALSEGITECLKLLEKEN